MTSVHLNNSMIDTYNYIIHLSDIHIRLKSREEEYRTVFEKLYKKIDEYISLVGNDGLIVITGDIFHDKVSLTSESVILCTELFINLSMRLGTIVIPGNHDGLLNSTERIDNISGVLYGKDIKNFYYLKDSGIYKFKNLLFGISSIFDDNFIDSTLLDNYIIENKLDNIIKIGLYHGMVGNVKLQNMCIAKGEKTVDDFKNYDYVLLGDIHTFQYLNDDKSIAYSSSLISQNYSETDKYHGFLYWDLKNKSSKYQIIENDYHHKICYLENNFLKIDNLQFDISSTDDLEKMRLHIPIKARVKIVIEDDLNNENFKYLKSQFKQISWNDVNNVLLNKGKKESERLTNVEINLEELIKEVLHNNHKKEIDNNIISFLHNDIVNRTNSKFKKGNNWELLKLNISNLCLYGDNNEIDLSTLSINEIILIHGQNNVGKSSIIDIISNILYNKMARKMYIGNKKSHDILNINKKDGFGEILFKVDDKIYLVKRTYKRNKKRELKVDSMLYRIMDDDIILDKYEDSYTYNKKDYRLELKTKGMSVNEDIEELLGSYDDFIFMNIMLQFDNISFRNMKQSSRKDLLNRLLDLDKYEEIREEILPIYEKYNDEYKDLYRKMKDIDIKSIKLECEEHVKLVEMNDMKLDKYENLKIELSEKINTLNINFTVIKNDVPLEKIDLQSFEIITNKNKDIKKKLKDISDNKKELEKKIFLLLDIEKENEILCNYKKDIESNNSLMENLNGELYKLLSDKKSLYDINNELTINNIEYKLKKYLDDICEIEKNEIEYQKILIDYEDILRIYNIEFDSKNKIINVLEHEISQLKKCKNIDKNILLESVEKNELILNNFEIESCKINDRINLLNESIDNEDKNGLIELFNKNELLKRDKIKIEDEIASKRKILTDLEMHEYNPECVQCMKNPIIVEMTRIKSELDILIDLNNNIVLTDNLDDLKKEYDRNKDELNLLYKDYNKSSVQIGKIKDIICTDKNSVRFIELTEQILYENNKWNSSELIIKKNEIEKKKCSFENAIKNKIDVETEINKLKDTDILLNKNEEIMNHNNNIDYKVKNINNQIEEIKNITYSVYEEYLEEKRIKDENDKKCVSLNLEEYELNNVFSKNKLLLDEINKKMAEKNIREENKRILDKVDKLKMELKDIDIDCNNLKLERYKEVEFIKKCQSSIIEYETNMKLYDNITENKELYGYYIELLHKNGLPLHILKRYLDHVSYGINSIIQTFLNKSIELYIEKDDIVLNIKVLDNNNDKYNISMMGGRETFIMDIAFKIVLSKIANLPKSNFLFIDEGISVLDKDNLSNIGELFDYLNNYYDYVFLISHIEEIKDYVNSKIDVKNYGGYSKILKN